MRTVTQKQNQPPEKGVLRRTGIGEWPRQNHYAGSSVFSRSAVGDSRTAAIPPPGIHLDFTHILLTRPQIQCKFIVNSPDDPFEREADAVAERVMRMPDPRTIQQPWSAATPANPLQQTCAKREEEEKHQLHGQETGAESQFAPPSVHHVLNSPGQPLDPSTRAFMEPRFRRDFSTVRVHTDEQAANSAKAVKALAYTTGNNIVFDAAQYDPSNSVGRRLLAHELTHVVQQGSANATLAVQRQKSTVKKRGPAADTASTTITDAGVEDKPHQCPDDAALDAKYDKWLHYPSKEDAEEQALVLRINREVFGPINKQRNKAAADSFENYEASKKGLPIGAMAYFWLHSDRPEDIERQQWTGRTRPAGDFSATGKVLTNTSFGGADEYPQGTLWDMTYGSEQQYISGFAEFKDPKNEKLLVPQLGFGPKPSVIQKQVMCHMVSIVKPGLARRRGGPAGESVTGSSILDKLLHRGKKFFSTKKKPTEIGEGEVVGETPGPHKPVHWYFHELPAEDDVRKRIEKTMQEKAKAIMTAKGKSYENLKQYYLQRAAFIAKYKARLGP